MDSSLVLPMQTRGMGEEFCALLRDVLMLEIGNLLV
jgi:hypothetical protein